MKLLASKFNEKIFFFRSQLYARAYVRIWTLRPWTTGHNISLNNTDYCVLLISEKYYNGIKLLFPPKLTHFFLVRTEPVNFVKSQIHVIDTGRESKQWKKSF